MKIIISPAKKMNHNEDVKTWAKLPHFVEHSEVLRDHLAGLTYEQLKTLWKCNDKIAELNYQRLCDMDLRGRLTAAVVAYEGLQYQYMAPHVFSEKQWQYADENLVILSGLYGMLRATDGITPYRLEMQAAFEMQDGKAMVKGLYQYWGDRIYHKLTEHDDIILNLASKEYSKVVERYVEPGVQFITCVFGEEVETDSGIKVKTKATQAKMARGEMVRYLAANDIHTIDGVKRFTGLDYLYREEHSRPNELVFIRQRGA